MGYNNYNREFEVNEEKTAEFLQNALDKVISEEDIDTLTDLIKLFKKSIPLSRRKYITAYLLKESLKHYHSFGKNTKSAKLNNRSRNESREFNSEYKKERREKPAQEAAAPVVEEEKPRHPRVEIDPAEATSIFISIGKNRRVYPRDLVGLLVAVAGIDRDRIGDIKVLANYSFVQLYTADSQTAIDKLNGYDYRGRSLTVSFSRQKGDEEAEADNEEVIADNVDSGYEVPVSETHMSEEQMSAEDAAALAAAEKAAADKEPFGNI